MTIFFNEKKEAFDELTKNNIGFVPIASVDDKIWAEYADTNQWDIINGEFVGEPNIEKYKANKKLKQELQTELNNLDLKRIRAIAEPSDKEEGLTWLEYYTDEITNLRNQIQEL